MFDIPELLPINFDEEIKKENKEDAKQLLENSRIIKEISQDLSNLIEDAEEPLKEADEHIEDAYESAKDAVVEIEEAKYHHFRSKLWKNTLLAGFFGFIIGGPAGGIIGTYTSVSAGGLGIASALFGGATSSAATYGILKNKISKSS